MDVLTCLQCIYCMGETNEFVEWCREDGHIIMDSQGFGNISPCALFTPARASPFTAIVEQSYEALPF